MTTSDYGENAVLDSFLNGASDPWIQLHSGDPGEAGTTNVVSIGRQQAAFNAPSGGSAANTSAINFASMPTVTVVGWSAWDAAGSGSPPTGGNCFWTGWLSTVKGLVVCRTADLSGNDLQGVTHGLVNTDRVEFETVEALTIPVGLTAGTLYFVISTGLTTDAFRVSTTSGGAAVDITGIGQALWRKVTPVAKTSGQTFTFGAGQLVVIDD